MSRRIAHPGTDKDRAVAGPVSLSPEVQVSGQRDEATSHIAQRGTTEPFVRRIRRERTPTLVDNGYRWDAEEDTVWFSNTIPWPPLVRLQIYQLEETGL
jgi:hypothetical protein